MKNIWFLLLAIPGLAFEEVKNGFEPKGKAKTLVFEEDLRMNAESGEDYHLWSGNSVAVEVDADGKMYVIDTGGNRVIIFNADGEYLREFGGKGKGPGEFQSLYNFTLLKDGGAIAFDNDQNNTFFHIFDKDMNFVKRVHGGYDPFIQAAFPAPDGKILSATCVREGEARSVLMEMGTKKEFKVLSKAQSPIFDGNRADDPSWWSSFLADWFKVGVNDVGVTAFTSDGKIYTAINTEYEITRYDSAFNEELVFTREFKPKFQSADTMQQYTEPIMDEVLSLLPPQLTRMITPKVIADAVEKAEFSPRRPPIFGMITMDTGELLVIHEFIPGEPAIADIFNTKGEFIGKTALPPIQISLFSSFFGTPAKIVFKNGFAYTTEPDEEGDFSMVRYRYHWQ